MKRIPLLIAPWLLLLSACQEPVPTPETSRYEVNMTIELPAFETTEAVRVQSVEAMFTDLNMRTTETITIDTVPLTDNTITLQTTIPAGFYDITATVDAIVDSTAYTLRAYYRSVAVTEPRAISAEAMLVQGKSDFILAEIFTPGTQTPQGKTYLGDRYFVVFNNSADTLYADGLVLLESKLKNSMQITLRPDFRSESFAADAIYRIPGNGTEYPIAPGGSLLIVDNAFNHREANPNSFDLSHADFEWYDQSTNPNVTDLDNPDVPNLDKIFCYTLTIWIPNSQGNTSFALGRIPDTLSADAYLRQYKFHYDYTIVSKTGTFDMDADTYLFPNEWIVDAVNLCPRTAYQWTAAAPSLDAGWTYVGETGSDKLRYGHSVRRKTLLEEGDRRILQDTNNSTDDFLPAQVADPFFFN